MRSDDFRSRDYPVDDNIAFQRKLWKLERVGWLLLLGLMVFALLGLFSRGPLSTQQRMTADEALQLHYQRFQRQDASDTLRVTLRGAPGETQHLLLEAPFFDTHNIETIQPQPLAAASEYGGLKLTVRLDPEGQASVHFGLRPQRIGPVHHRVRVGNQQLTFWQFIYP
jgi:hypothetical protein